MQTPTPAAQARPGASRLRLAIAGFGTRGQQLCRLAAGVPGVEIAAVADAYDGRLRRAAELLGEKVGVERDARRLLERRDVDAVVVATPDHLHAPLAIAAASAGKHVYCESPIIHRAEDAERLRSAFGGGAVRFAGGAGASTSPVLQAARELVQSGRLGRVLMVRATWDSNGSIEAWQTPFPPDASPESVNYQTFSGLGATDPDLKRFFRWRCYRDYGSGLVGARVIPMLAEARVVAGVDTLEHAVAAGTLVRWKDGRDVPDVMTASATFGNGVVVWLAASQTGPGDRRVLQVVGTEASLVVCGREVTILPEPQAEPFAEVAETWPREYRDWFYMMHGMSPTGQVRGTPPPEPVEERFEVPEGAGTAAAPLADFVDAVRSSRRPRETLDEALLVCGWGLTLGRAMENRP